MASLLLLYARGRASTSAQNLKSALLLDVAGGAPASGGGFTFATLSAATAAPTGGADAPEEQPSSGAGFVFAHKEPVAFGSLSLSAASTGDGGSGHAAAASSGGDEGALAVTEEFSPEADDGGSDDVEAEREEERAKVRGAFAALNEGGGGGSIAAAQFAELFEALGTTYNEEAHTKTLRRLQDGAGRVPLDAFLDWYIEWLLGDDDDASDDGSAAAADDGGSGSGGGGGSGAAATQGFGDMFKAVAGEWKCEACLVRNPPTAVKCVSCETPGPGAAAEAAPAAAAPPGAARAGGRETAAAGGGIGPSGFHFGDSSGGTGSSGGGGGGGGSSGAAGGGVWGAFKPPAGHWKCKVCCVYNRDGASKCQSCETPAADAAAAGAGAGASARMSSAAATGGTIGPTGFSFAAAGANVAGCESLLPAFVKMSLVLWSPPLQAYASFSHHVGQAVRKRRTSIAPCNLTIW
ncbi:hypothetical protein JKP88DRAFT_162323 [Tribonema minus]|uniref:Nuclear pore complex protein Nup153 n=1 Tax=Tribonema minus TaxID=303371 RepID=A0A835Z9Q0_9STRA|nr:hypothetical protein JKP88DRAFT_162323 [Tribonema minus]